MTVSWNSRYVPYILRNEILRDEEETIRHFEYVRFLPQSFGVEVVLSFHGRCPGRSFPTNCASARLLKSQYKRDDLFVRSIRMWMRFPYPANVTLFAGLCVFFAEIVQKDFATAEVSLFGIVQHSLNPLFKIFLAFVVHGRREYDTFFFDAFTGKGDIRRFCGGCNGGFWPCQVPTVHGKPGLWSGRIKSRYAVRL